jgi:hypothetical protein
MLIPTIDQYLLSTCLFIIDEFNQMYSYIDKDDLKKISDNEFNEMDICTRIGSPFRNMIHYTVGDRNKSKSNHDLYVKSKDFRIKVEFLKNFKSENGTNSSSKNWSVCQQDFNWLEEEIKEGNKGKCAFVIGWFNCVNSFSQIMQLGCTRGSKPKIDPYKIGYFPFLKKVGVSYTKDLEYNYKRAYRPLDVDIKDDLDIEYKCMFLVNENDKFHFALYY